MTTREQRRQAVARPGTGSVAPALSELVRDVMQRRSLTLEAVASRGGLSISAVATLRSGVRGKRPRLTTLRRLAVGLGVDEDVVFAAARATDRQDADREAQLLRSYRGLTPSERSAVDEFVRRLTGDG